MNWEPEFEDRCREGVTGTGARRRDGQKAIEGFRSQADSPALFGERARAGARPTKAADAKASRARTASTIPADEEHDACGVGLVASIDGKPRREVVEAGIEALKAVWHRGAVDADGKTGDGAGIHVQIPQDFFRSTSRAPATSRARGACIGVGMVFLPRTDFAAQERCRVIVEREILNFGYRIYGWRQVPVNTDGDRREGQRHPARDRADHDRQQPRQVTDDKQFEVDLYVIRRRIEKAAQEESIKDFYICSLSCRSIIYKGMFLAEQLTAFYPDLLDERFVSNFAIFHQRYSTNTFPTWWLAQPFRVLAHNGEINTLRATSTG